MLWGSAFFSPFRYFPRKYCPNNWNTIQFSTFTFNGNEISFHHFVVKLVEFFKNKVKPFFSPSFRLLSRIMIVIVISRTGHRPSTSVFSFRFVSSTFWINRLAIYFKYSPLSMRMSNTPYVRGLVWFCISFQWKFSLNFFLKFFSLKTFLNKRYGVSVVVCELGI